MSNRLLTIEGLYDGKSIKPLAEVKTGKQHRVLITFLDEPAPLDYTPSEKEEELPNIPAGLFKQLQTLASAAGLEDLRSFIVGILEEKVQAAKDKEFVYAVTDEIRAGLTRAGINEDEVLEDFNRFRRTLARE